MIAGAMLLRFIKEAFQQNLVEDLVENAFALLPYRLAPLGAGFAWARLTRAAVNLDASLDAEARKFGVWTPPRFHM
jgi:hypothetical protein